MFELFNQINQHIYAFINIKQQQKKEDIEKEKDIFFAISANSDLWNYFHINEWIKRRTIGNKKTESSSVFIVIRKHLLSCKQLEDYYHHIILS